MKKYFLYVLVITLLCSLLPMSSNAAAQSSDANDSSARTFINDLYTKKYTSAVKLLDSSVVPYLPANILKEAWESYLSTAGSYQKVMSTKAGLNSVIVTTKHQYRSILSTISFNSNGKIIGFSYRSEVQNAIVTSTVATKFSTEYHFTLTCGSYKLPAVLSLPLKAKNCTAVILVHGTGATDMDEAIGPNKPFRDIAEGLVKKGIAVLRYDKRTFIYGDTIDYKTFTAQQEYIDDAVAAYQWLLTKKEINPKQIYLAGHSMGGMLAPRISMSCPKLAGMILLAGSPRHLEDILVDQYALRAPVQLQAIKEQAKNIKVLCKATTFDPNLAYAGAYATYWRDLNSIDALSAAKKVNKRMLILQGERDAQVFFKQDFGAWKTGLKGFTKATYCSYAKLNHLFMEGTGAPNVQEYAIPSHVAQYVMNDISTWVKMG